MPLFMVYCRDKPGHLDVRLANRPDHLAWARSASLTIAMAGPLFADDGETFAGSVFVVSADSLEDVQTWQATDPYQRAGLFGSVLITPFAWLLGDGKPE